MAQVEDQRLPAMETAATSRILLQQTLFAVTV